MLNVCREDRAAGAEGRQCDARTGITRDAGYTIGHHITRDYLKRHPGTSFATLATLNAGTIFSGSGYSG